MITKGSVAAAVAVLVAITGVAFGGPTQQACQNVMNSRDRFMKIANAAQTQCQNLAQANKPTKIVYSRYLGACNNQDAAERRFFSLGCDKAFPDMPAPGQGPNMCAQQVKDNCPLIGAGGSAASAQQSNPVVQQQNPVTQQQNLAPNQRNPAVQQRNPAVQQRNPVVQQRNPVVRQRNPVVQQRNLAVQQRKPVVQQRNLAVQQRKPVVQQRKPVVPRAPVAPKKPVPKKVPAKNPNDQR